MYFAISSDREASMTTATLSDKDIHVRDAVVHNHIEVIPKTATRDIHRRIVAALHRTADLDARRISVKVIARVENHILVGPIKSADEPDEIC
jgi:osmotically-inducible protein OsmY